MVSEQLRKAAEKEAKKVGLRVLAGEVDMAPSGLSRLISGERPPSGEVVDKLAKRLRLRLAKK